MEDFFKYCSDEKEIKTLYRKLARIHHPDLATGNLEMMKQLNLQYEKALKFDYTTRQDYSESEASKRWEMDEEIAGKAHEASKLSQDLIVEVCGLWVWVTGATYAYKDSLKGMAYRFSSKKCAWYFRKESDKPAWHKKAYSLDEIRNKYGSSRVANENAGRYSIA